MKILVVSLLRLGDFVMHVPAIAGLKNKYPRAKIDVLCHRPVAAMQPMLPIVDRWWTLDRDELQAGLGRAEIPMLTAFDVLREQCEAINAEKYDLIVNLTQTHFSGYLMGYFVARAKLGLTHNPNGGSDFHSPWFRYLDEHADDRDVFHFADVFAQASETFGEARRWPLVLTPKGDAEVRALGLPRGREWIAIQALTSDDKKNWGVETWATWLAQMRERRPGSHFVLIGAPNEKERLQAILERVADSEKFIALAILSLEGVLSLLQRVTLLVTGDTSIKHLANAGRCRVVELALGSSDFRRTGIYRDNSLIVSAKLACAPCPHSGGCTQSRHECARQVGANEFAAVVDLYLQDDWNALRALALGADFSIRRTRVVAMGFWYAQDVSGRAAEDTLQDWIERSAWKFLLSSEEKGRVPSVGTEIYRLKTEINDLVPLAGLEPLLAKLDFIEKELGAKHSTFTAGLREFEQSKNDSAGQSTFDLSGLRTRQNRLRFLEKEIEIKMKMVRSLKTQLVEKA